MRIPKDTLLLYAVTDRRGMGDTPLTSAVEAALEGGVTCVQLREKNLSDEEYLAMAKAIKAVTDHYSVPLIINDRVDIALAADADGVHIGQKDGSVKDARRILGPDKILGVTARSLEQALCAEDEGADYLGVGAMFPTATKNDAVVTPRATVLAIADGLSIPFVVIGGINRDNVRELKGLGASGAAVASAIFSGDYYDNALTLRTLCEEVFHNV